MIVWSQLRQLSAGLQQFIEALWVIENLYGFRRVLGQPKQQLLIFNNGRGLAFLMKVSRR